MTAKVGNNTNKWEGKYRHIGDLDQELRLFFFLNFLYPSTNVYRQQLDETFGLEFKIPLKN